MSAFAKSMGSLFWSASVFGVQQMVNTLSLRNDTKAKADSYRVTEVIEEQFAENPFAFAVNEIGDYVQGTALDLFNDLLRLQALNPRWLKGVACALVQQSADTTRALTPGTGLNTTWATLKSTLVVVNLVNQAAAMLQLPAGELDLVPAVARAYSFGAYSSLWVVEGLGREYADASWLQGAPPHELLTTGQGANVPESSLLMLHAGMGISFARRYLRPLSPYSSRPEIAEALHNFAGLVRSNSREGYEGAAFESLGLVTRTWYPQMVQLIEQTLWTADLKMVPYFWHGVGRATYFSPLNMIPGNTSFRGLAKEATHQLGLANATAGAAWAFTLVNINQPEIIVNLLAEYIRASAGEQFFSNGMISALMMASETVPGDPYTGALCQYVPQSGDADLLKLWDRIVRSPCQQARDLYLPILKVYNRLGEIFRYQDIYELTNHSEEVN